jgi:hypothetical protein
MKLNLPFFRDVRRIGGKLTSSAFPRGFDLPSILILLRSSIHLAQQQKKRVLQGTVVLHTQYPARVTNAHRSPIGEKYGEKCHTCEESKHKATYKRNVVFNGTTTSTNVPYWRLYSDAYGGQRSI